MLPRGEELDKPGCEGGSQDLVRDEDGIAESRAPCRENAIAAGLSNPSQQELTSSRAERRELKKKQVAQKQAQKQDVDLNNRYNHTEKNKFKISDLGSAQLSKREAEKKAATERFRELHRAGKSRQAKSDLARLKKIKEEREAAQAKRKAEAEAKATEVEVKKKAIMGGKRI